MRKLLGSVCLLALVAGCGGGGGSATTNTTKSTTAATINPNSIGTVSADDLAKTRDGIFYLLTNLTTLAGGTVDETCLRNGIASQTNEQLTQLKPLVNNAGGSTLAQTEPFASCLNVGDAGEVSSATGAATTPTTAATAATTTAPADPENPKYSDSFCNPSRGYCLWPTDANNSTISDELCNMPLKEAGDAFALLDVSAQRRVLDEMSVLCFFPQAGLVFYLGNLGLLP